MQRRPFDGVGHENWFRVVHLLAETISMTPPYFDHTVVCHMDALHVKAHNMIGLVGPLLPGRDTQKEPTLGALTDRLQRHYTDLLVVFIFARPPTVGQLVPVGRMEERCVFERRLNGWKACMHKGCTESVDHPDGLPFVCQRVRTITEEPSITPRLTQTGSRQCYGARYCSLGK